MLLKGLPDVSTEAVFELQSLRAQCMKGRHTSLDKSLKNNILWIENLFGVSKVVLGFSIACRHKYPPGHIRFKKEVEGGIKVNAYSGKGVTDIFIRIDPLDQKETIKALIKKRFSLKTTQED